MAHTPDDLARGTRLYGASYALAWFCIALVAGPGSAALVALSGRLADAGLFIAVYFVGAAAGGALGGRAMDRWGRRPALAAGHTLGAAGFAGAGTGVAIGNLWTFVIGVVVLAVGMGVVYLTRLAVAELFPPAERGRGMGAVQVSAIFGAIAGPLVLVFAEPLGVLIGQDPRTLIWFVAPPLLLLAAGLVLRAPESRPRAGAGRSDEPDVQRRTRAGPRMPLVAGGASLAMAQAAMVMAMGVTGAAMASQGYDLRALGVVMTAHFAGMFALSRQVGTLADRFGRRRTALAGLMMLAVGGGTMGVWRSGTGLTVALFLVGLGWSLAYIAGSLIVTDVTAPDVSARVLGRVDAITAVLAAASSAGGGWWFARHGLPGLGVLAALLVVVPIVLAIALRETSPGRYPGIDAAADDAVVPLA